MRTGELTKKVPFATGTSQANTGTFDYLAFGHIFRSTLGAFYVNLYTGQSGYLFFNHDAVPMYYTQARWYDPNTGSRLSRDPNGYRGRDWNFYRFVANNPLNWEDPSGSQSATWPGNSAPFPFPPIFRPLPPISAPVPLQLPTPTPPVGPAAGAGGIAVEGGATAGAGVEGETALGICLAPPGCAEIIGTLIIAGLIGTAIYLAI